MNKQTKRRALLFAYFSLGLMVGGYLICLLVDEFGSEQSLNHASRILPVALLTVLYFPAPLCAATQSWRLLFPPGEEPDMRLSAVRTWIGLSVNWLLPVALVGGELVKFRLAFQGVPYAGSLIASLVGDKTIQVATQLLYTLLGLSVLAWASERFGGGVREGIGFALFGVAIYLFYRLQRAGMFTRAARRLKAFIGTQEHIELSAERVDAALDGMYRRSGRWWRAVGWRIVFRVSLAMEVAMVLWWLGQPVGIWAVLGLESVAQAARVAALVIPAALGAQETAIMAAGLLLGYPAEVLFALAVAKRIRELLVGGGGLLVWQLIEGRSLIKGKN